MLYVSGKITKYYEDFAFKSYVSDSLMYIAGNTARIGGGSAPKNRYADIISPRNVDNRTGKEIVEDVIKKAGLEVIDE